MGFIPSPQVTILSPDYPCIVDINDAKTAFILDKSILIDSLRIVPEGHYASIEFASRYNDKFFHGHSIVVKKLKNKNSLKDEYSVYDSSVGAIFNIKETEIGRVVQAIINKYAMKWYNQDRSMVDYISIKDSTKFLEEIEQYTSNNRRKECTTYRIPVNHNTISRFDYYQHTTTNFPAEHVSYYDTLKVKRNASSEKIKEAYKKLALRYHPDKNHENLEAVKEFQKIDKANRILSDSRKRRLYDLYTHAEFIKLEKRFGEAMVFEKIEEEFGNNNKNRSVIDNISVNVLKVVYQSVCC